MKDQAYHEAAIKYNEGLAEYAETLAPTLGHPEVQRWCTAVGKQHRFHANRHQKALNKILEKESAEENVEPIADGLDVPEPAEVPEAGEGLVSEDTPASIGASNEAGYETDESIEENAPHVFDDGCVGVHKPLENPHCEFNPNKAVTPNA